MKRLVVLLVVLVSGIWASNAMEATSANQFVGTWNFEACEAPYEYSSGQFIVDDVDGKTTVTIKFPDGSKLKAQKVSCDKNSLSFMLNIEYNEVTVSCGLKSGKLIGIADSGEGELEITAVKKK